MRAAQSFRIGNSRGSPAFAPVILFGLGGLAAFMSHHVNVIEAKYNSTRTRENPEGGCQVRCKAINAQIVPDIAKCAIRSGIPTVNFLALGNISPLRRECRSLTWEGITVGLDNATEQISRPIRFILHHRDCCIVILGFKLRHPVVDVTNHLSVGCCGWKEFHLAKFAQQSKYDKERARSRARSIFASGLVLMVL